MIYGYARVSTGAQDLTSQLAQLKAAGCEKVFREKLTGTTADRPQLQKLITKLAPGDVVIIPAVDRMSRDTTDLLIIAREMQKAGAGIRSLAEPFLDTTSDFAEIVFAILGVAAKLGRRRILDRTARGRADAKAKGVKFGRKPTLTPHQQKEAIRRRDVDGETLRSMLAATMSARRRFRDWQPDLYLHEVRREDDTTSALKINMETLIDNIFIPLLLSGFLILIGLQIAQHLGETRATLLSAVATALLALATACLAFMGYRQLNEMRTDRRAWVGPLVGKLQQPLRFNVAADIVISLQNTGKEPATNVAYFPQITTPY